MFTCIFNVFIIIITNYEYIEMSFITNENQPQGSNFNPFAPTKRDIERTEILASKKVFKAGYLGFFIPLVAMIYLDRGINSLKIYLYGIILIFAVAIVSHNSNVEQLRIIAIGIGFLVNLLLMIENIRAVTLARERQWETDF